MSRPLTVDHQLVVELYATGCTRKEVAERVGCSPVSAATIYQAHKNSVCKCETSNVIKTAETLQKQENIVIETRNDNGKSVNGKLAQLSREILEALVQKSVDECKSLSSRLAEAEEERDSYAAIATRKLASAEQVSLIRDEVSQLKADNEKLRAVISANGKTALSITSPAAIAAAIGNQKTHLACYKYTSSLFKRLQEIQQSAASGDDGESNCTLDMLGRKFCLDLEAFYTAIHKSVTGLQPEVDYDNGTVIIDETVLTPDKQMKNAKLLANIKSSVTWMLKTNPANQALTKLDKQLSELDYAMFRDVEI